MSTEERNRPAETAATTVLARTPESKGRYRRALAREWIGDRFWVVPTIFVVGGVLLGIAVARVDDLPVLRDLALRIPISAEAAELILGVIASSMLTFVGVVFTITLVALQLASAQLSPRVIRTFVRSGVTKVAFGIFLATFAYAVVVLVAEGASSSRAVQRGAVTVGVALVSASLVVFVVYVTATMRLLQVSWVITAVADETRRSVGVHYPVESAYVAATTPSLVEEPRLVRLLREDADGGGGRLGVVLGVDSGRLVELAARHGCVLEVLPRVGEYLPTGAAVVAVHGSAGPPDTQVRRCILLGRSRTLYQDPTFGIRQLVDVASQALSPAINQPTTAVYVINRLEDILLRIANRPPPTGAFVDTAGVVRLILPATAWAEIVDLAFTEIAVYGASSPAVVRRLAGAYDRLHGAVPFELRGDLLRHIEVLDRLVRAANVSDNPLLVPRPDPRGLG